MTVPSEMPALRDAIAAEVWNARIHSDCGQNAADAILAMPEMQAIKQALRRMTGYIATIQGLDVADALDWYMPDEDVDMSHVVRWVLS